MCTLRERESVCVCVEGLVVLHVARCNVCSCCTRLQRGRTHIICIYFFKIKKLLTFVQNLSHYFSKSEAF